MPGGSGVQWPLIGRTEELHLLRALRNARPATSAVISGPAGVGKSRLAREALQEAAHEGWPTLAIRGTTGYAIVPFGPLRSVLNVPSNNDATELMTSIEQELLGMRTSRELMLVADDAQHLDDASAGLLHQLAASAAIVLVLTTRTGTQVPAALTELWKDGLAERIELQSLSRRETTELLTASLGGPIKDSSAGRIWHITGGNPLYLREVIHSSQETGSLRLVDEEWRWRGD